MGLRPDAMLQAVRLLRPAVEKFYQSLSDEQKARFNALGADDGPDQQQSRRDLSQACGERASGIASLPLERIERAGLQENGELGDRTGRHGQMSLSARPTNCIQRRTR